MEEAPGKQDAEGMLREWMAESNGGRAAEPHPLRDTHGENPKEEVSGKKAEEQACRVVAGSLTVHCHKAAGLQKMDTFTGKADPYLVLTVGEVSSSSNLNYYQLI